MKLEAELRAFSEFLAKHRTYEQIARSKARYLNKPYRVTLGRITEAFDAAIMLKDEIE